MRDVISACDSAGSLDATQLDNLAQCGAASLGLVRGLHIADRCVCRAHRLCPMLCVCVVFDKISNKQSVMKCWLRVRLACVRATLKTQQICASTIASYFSSYYDYSYGDYSSGCESVCVKSQPKAIARQGNCCRWWSHQDLVTQGGVPVRRDDGPDRACLPISLLSLGC